MKTWNNAEIVELNIAATQSEVVADASCDDWTEDGKPVTANDKGWGYANLGSGPKGSLTIDTYHK